MNFRTSNSIFKSIKSTRLILGFAFCLIIGCATRPDVRDETPTPVFAKPGSQTGNTAISRRNPAKDLFFKKKTISIVPIEKPNTNGSLFNLDDERNYLFSARGPLTTGRYIDIKVGSMRVAKKNDDSEGKKTEDASGDSVEDTLIKSLPELEPDSSEATVIKRFKMKIAHRYSNGDLLVVSQRKSEGDENANEIALQARIPYDRLISGRDISTDDLTNVSMVENNNGETIERRSSGWEDDYTLRMSGFNEAKSKIASRLDQQRDQLKKIREQLRTRLVSAGKERKQMAVERNKLLESGQSSRTEIEKLNTSLTEKDTMINTQKTALAERDKQIEELTKESAVAAEEGE